MNECPRCGRLESHTEICALQGEIERLRAELAEAKRDAERYRWLTLTSDTNPLMICDVQSGRLLFGYEADAEIDIHRYGGR